MNSRIANQISLYFRITPKRVTSGGAHLRGLSPGQRNFDQTSQRWRAVGDNASDLTDPEIEPMTSRANSDVINQYANRPAHCCSKTGMANLFEPWVKFKVVDRKNKKRGLRFRPKSGDEQQKGHRVRRCPSRPHRVRRCPIFRPKSGEEQNKRRSSRPRADKIVGH